MQTLLTETIGYLFLACSIVLLLIQLAYYLIIYIRIANRQKKVEKAKIQLSEDYPPLSVILYTSGPIESLGENLIQILEQDYPLFEVVVINDNKKDENETTLLQLKEKYPHLYISFLPDSSRWVSRKKLAISLGIRAAKYDWLVFTEPNCRPNSNQWLRLFSRNFTPTTEIVLGYSSFIHGKSWLQRKVAFDNLFRSIRYLGLAILRFPYMGMGRNMAYRKELFLNNKGFGRSLDMLKGDDDLFINQMANSKNTRVETDALSVIKMPLLENKKTWSVERMNYEATSRHYHGIQRYLLGFETFSRLLLYILCIIGIIVSILTTNWILLATMLTIIIIKYAVQGYVINQTAMVLGEKERYYFTLPILDIIQPFQSLGWHLKYLFSNKNDFKRKSEFTRSVSNWQD